MPKARKPATSQMPGGIITAIIPPKGRAASAKKHPRHPRRTARLPYRKSPANRVFDELTQLLGDTSLQQARQLRIEHQAFLDIALGRRRVGAELLLRLAHEMQFRGFYVGERAAIAANLLELRSVKRYAHLVPEPAVRWCELAVKELEQLQLTHLLNAIDKARRAGLVR